MKNKPNVPMFADKNCPSSTKGIAVPIVMFKHSSNAESTEGGIGVSCIELSSVLENAAELL